MTPQVQAVRFAASLVIGLGLGVFYCFLRPLRPKLTALADGIFVTCSLIGWTYAAFYFCRGDIRMGYTFGFFLGMGIGWRTLGLWLSPVFFAFWRLVRKGVGIALFPFGFILKKIIRWIKFLFASWKKWGTIEWNNRRHFRRVSGGPYETDQHPPRHDHIQTTAQLDTHQGDRPHRRHTVYRCDFDAADGRCVHPERRRRSATRGHRSGAGTKSA